MVPWEVLLVLAGAAGWLAAALVGVMPRRGRTWSAIFSWCASVLGLTGTVVALMGDGTGSWAWTWMHGWTARVAVDHLSAAFLLPIFVLGTLAVQYAQGYFHADLDGSAARRLRFGIGLLVAAMTLVVTARQGVLFLTAWEIMALAAYILITTEDRLDEVRIAGWVYLVAAHLGTLALIAMTALLSLRCGGWDWCAVAGTTAPIDTAILLLAIGGFGCKAGLFPMHVWLPGAHAVAPSPASALLSGVVLNTGIYGLLRVSSLLPAAPLWLGGALVVMGCFSALFGIITALNQSDLKRLLAYSSIENLGIITIGVGLAWIGRTTSQPEFVALGLGGAVLHLWNHGLFKTLLFHVAGAVVHATGTRQLDQLGGLAKRMPTTAGCAVIGCLSVSALPPFNGFIGEWLLYRAGFNSVGQHAWLAVLVIPVLALTGGLAAAAFLKWFGSIFLGEPRDPTIPAGHEPPMAMGRVMVWAACGCALMGLLIVLVIPVLSRIVASWVPGAAVPLATLVSDDLGRLGVVASVLCALGGVGWWALQRQLRRNGIRRAPTWDCGYLTPTPRMQYTARSFTAWLGEMIPGLRATIHMPRLSLLFPRRDTLVCSAPDLMQDGVYVPWFTRIAGRLMRLRFLQQGLLHVYLLYILIALVAAFVWMLVRS